MHEAFANVESKEDQSMEISDVKYVRQQFSNFPKPCPLCNFLRTSFVTETKN